MNVTEHTLKIGAIEICACIRIILDIFAEDKKAMFNVNLEVFGIRNFLEMLRYVSADSDSVYRILINELKQQLKSGELDVSFS